MGHDFLGFVERNKLGQEGSLFSYLARVMKTARRIAEATSAPEFAEMDARIRTTSRWSTRGWPPISVQ